MSAATTISGWVFTQDEDGNFIARIKPEDYIILPNTAAKGNGESI